MSNVKKIITLSFLVVFSAILPLAASAASVNISFLEKGSSNPGEFVSNLYKFALGIAGAAAFAVIIYGAIIYATSAGNPSKQKDAWDWIKGAIWGVILLLAAYLILYTINPNLVDLTSPELKKVNLGPVSDALAASSLQDLKNADENRIRKTISNWGVKTKDPCLPGLYLGCVTLAGMRPETLEEVRNLAGRVGSSNIFITGGTEGNGSVHVIGDHSHGNGYKFDVGLNPSLNSYITNQFKSIGARESDGAALYQSSSGAVYALESDHWDVLVQ